MSAPASANAASNEIYYPESDHMGESGLQKWVCDLLIQLLRSFFDEKVERPMLVGGNQFFYLREGDTELRLAPDVYVIEDEITPITNVKSWRLWEHEGQGPALAVEVVSEEYDKDYDPAQLIKYQRLGVRELVRYDPEFSLHQRALKFGPRRLLTHWVRTQEGLLVERPLATKRSIRSTLYDFWFVHEPHRDLRLGVGPEGRRLWPTAQERARAEAEARQAEAEAHLNDARSAVADLCEALDIPLTPERQAEMACLDAEALRALRGHLKSKRAWPGSV